MNWFFIPSVFLVDFPSKFIWKANFRHIANLPLLIALWNFRLSPQISYEPMIYGSIKTLRPRQNGRHFADDVFKCIFLKENVWLSPKILLKFVPDGPINNIP